jgi:hypothetical protein
MTVPGFHVIHPLLIIVTSLLAAACAPSAVDTVADAEKEPVAAINSVIILPAESVRAVSNGNDEQTGINELQEGCQVINELLAEYAANLSNVRVIPEAELEGQLVEISGSRLATARKIALREGGDAVMVSTVKRFVHRDAPSSRPASVAFDYQLVAVDNGQVLCSGFFDETQQPLFENILSLRRAMSRKFKWISARQLAREGLIDKLDKCIYFHRDQQKVP